MVDASVLVTHLNDVRGVDAVDSLAGSKPLPVEVVLADGGSQADVLAAYERASDAWPFPLRVVDAPGSVAESREGAWSACRGDAIVFLDTDERAPAGWLGRILAPIEAGEVDFTAGPTRARHVRDAWDQYHAAVDAWFYRNFVAEDVVYAPMGNTAWRRPIFDRLAEDDGHVFDVTLARGGEDFDVSIRALKAGFRGRFVPEAVLEHDYSRVKGYAKVLRKKYWYARAEFRVMRRHADFFARRDVPRPSEPKPWHPMELFEPFVRRYAWLRDRIDAA